MDLKILHNCYLGTDLTEAVVICWLSLNNSQCLDYLAVPSDWKYVNVRTTSQEHFERKARST